MTPGIFVQGCGDAIKVFSSHQSDQIIVLLYNLRRYTISNEHTSGNSNANFMKIMLIQQNINSIEINPQTRFQRQFAPVLSFLHQQNASERPRQSSQDPCGSQLNKIELIKDSKSENKNFIAQKFVAAFHFKHRVGTCFALPIPLEPATLHV